jgi:hypothetical protein
MEPKGVFAVLASIPTPLSTASAAGTRSVANLKALLRKGFGLCMMTTLLPPNLLDQTVWQVSGQAKR